MAGRTANHIWVRGTINHVEVVEKKVIDPTNPDGLSQLSYEMTIVPEKNPEGNTGDNLVGSRAGQVIGVIPSSSPGLLDFTEQLPLLNQHVLAVGSTTTELADSQFHIEAFSPFTSDSKLEDFEQMSRALNRKKRRLQSGRPPVVGNDARITRAIHNRNLDQKAEEELHSHLHLDPLDPAVRAGAPEVNDVPDDLQPAINRTIDATPTPPRPKPRLNLTQVNQQDPRSRIALALKDKEGAEKVFGQNPTDYLLSRQEESHYNDDVKEDTDDHDK